MRLSQGLRIFIILLMLITPRVAISSWAGPVEIVKGSWGKGIDQFGHRSGESRDYFPESIVVFSDGRIMIDDSVNGRILFYESNGRLIKSIKSRGAFVEALCGFNQGKVVAFDWDINNKVLRLGVYDIVLEKWLWRDMSTVFIPNSANSIKVYHDRILVLHGRRAGFIYSLIGKLLNTFTTQSAEFGAIKSAVRQPDGNYRIIVAYADMAYDLTVSSNVDIQDLTRDRFSNIYAIAYAPTNTDESPYRVYKYDRCGNTRGFVDLPSNDIVYPEFKQLFPRQPGPKAIVNGEYGYPVIAPNGDVYTWKKSDKYYSILKWTWIDDPAVSQDRCSDIEINHIK